METYSFLRELADSWVLLALTLFFLGVIGWAWRPGSRPIHDDAADVPFRHDDRAPTVPPGADADFALGDHPHVPQTHMPQLPEVQQ